MTFEQFVNLLTQRGLSPRKEGRGVRCRCPSHNDDGRRPDLVASPGDGAILLKCYKDCTGESICRALDIAISELFYRPRDGQSVKSATTRRAKKAYASVPDAARAIGRREQGALAGTWFYYRSDGELSFVVFRFNLGGGDKTYRPLTANGEGFCEGDPAGLLPLYNLPAILTTNPSEWIVVTEGEKAADLAKDIGFVATTSAHGSNSAAKTDWTPLAGRRVLLMPDNDKAGEKYVRDVIGLIPEPAEMSIVRLPGIPERGDLVEWITAKPEIPSDFAVLRNEIRALAIPVEVSSREPGEDADEPPVQKPKPKSYELVQVELGQMKRVRWLITDTIPLGKLSILGGMPGVSKSLLTCYLAASMQGATEGLPANEYGQPTTILPGKMLIVSAEDDPYDTIAPRLAVYGLDPASTPIFKGAATLVHGVRTVDLLDLGRHIPNLCEYLDDFPDTRIMVIDPVQTFMGETNINANAPVNQVLSRLAQVAAKRNVAVLMITHFSKKSDLTSVMDMITGSRGFTGTVRAGWTVQRDPDDKKHFYFGCLKLQNRPPQQAFGYRIETKEVEIEGELEPTPFLVFDDERFNVEPDDLLVQANKMSREDRTAECVAWMSDQLKKWSGPMPLKLLRDRGREAKFGNTTINKAREILRLVDIEDEPPKKGGKRQILVAFPKL